MLFSKLTALTLGGAAVAAGVRNRPNILLILTDDQDVHMKSLDYMPLTQKYLIEKGTRFKKHYCTGGLQSSVPYRHYTSFG
jgi:N-acetylglucosamine-6-sulfatase